MSDINSSLVGFLKKKSLFANSPDKNKKTRQLSRDKKMSQSQKSHKMISYNPQRNFDFNNSAQSKNLQKHSSVQYLGHVDGEAESVLIQSPPRYQPTSTHADQRQKLMKRNFNFQHQQQQQQPKQQQYDFSGSQQHDQQQSKNSWIGIVSKAITFESARIESAQCLDNMSMKLQTQISSINYKIDAFCSKISQILDEQFQTLREKIYFMVDNVIQQSQNNIRAYIQNQQKTLAADLITMRQNLVQENQKIEHMKQEINKPNWRKVAGELLASELEQKIQDILQKSKSLNVKHWQIRNLGQDKLPSLQRELRNVVKLGYT